MTQPRLNAGPMVGQALNATPGLTWVGARPLARSIERLPTDTFTPPGLTGRRLLQPAGGGNGGKGAELCEIVPQVRHHGRSDVEVPNWHHPVRMRPEAP
jgi:hypothetical protein